MAVNRDNRVAIRTTALRDVAITMRGIAIQQGVLVLGEVHGLRPITPVKANIYHLNNGEDIMRVLTTSEVQKVAGAKLPIVVNPWLIGFTIGIPLAMRIFGIINRNTKKK